ncbi:MAG: BatA domain-containing protein, partial [Sedimentisphaerales bacterium]|nr:BatA domain-containing protein [Sedimentisphaerales bacterium]
MSLLYPLFLAGIAAVTLPIVLHMIRRHTSRRVPFSTLMFLRTTAPRLKNRRRLEHVPLLMLRCLILCLLALAFARPFIPRPVAHDRVRVGKRLVVLVDTSASMRRTGVRDRALSEARAAIQNVGPADRLCLMSFDRDTRTLVGFEQWASMDPAQRRSITLRQLSELSPGWGPTGLGRALISAAEAIEDDEVNETPRVDGQGQILLISDLQQGSDIEVLTSYEWPEHTKVIVRSISPRETTNASLQLMAGPGRLAPADGNEPVRIRVTNSADAAKERFQLGWADEGSTANVYVPPGRSVVVSAPARPALSTARRLVLADDDHDFDNTLYVAPSAPLPVNVLYLGDDDPNDPKDMLFYVRQAFDIEGPLATRVSHQAGDEMLALEDIRTMHLIILADTVNGQSLPPLRGYLESGRTILLVMKSAELVTTLAGLAGVDALESQEADVDRYAMLAQIEFDHPLLASFSDPRFGDFTRIHFWKYRRIDPTDIPTAHVLVQFDSNDPAWFEVPVGRGTLFVWTSGWHPADSDLALSSKFAPLLYSALEYGGTLLDRQAQYAVGDTVPLPAGTMSGVNDRRVRRPDGSVTDLDADDQVFAETDLP